MRVVDESRIMVYKKTMSKRKLRFSDQIRAAIDDSEMTRYAIAKKLGIAQATMSRFMADKRGMRLSVIDDLADLLGLEVVVKRSRR